MAVSNDPVLQRLPRPGKRRCRSPPTPKSSTLVGYSLFSSLVALYAVAEIVWPLVFAFPIEWGRQLR
jgi:hypothetical protein